jgi:hypothetical protein
MLHRCHHNGGSWLFLLIALLGGVGQALALPFAYVANDTSNNVSAYTINALTGALTPVVGSSFAAGTNPASVTTTNTVLSVASAIPAVSPIGLILLVLTIAMIGALQRRRSSR